MIQSYIWLLLAAGICSIISVTALVETILIKEIDNNGNLVFMFYIISIMFALATFVLIVFARILQKEYYLRLLIISRQSAEAANEVINAL